MTSWEELQNEWGWEKCCFSDFYEWRFWILKIWISAIWNPSDEPKNFIEIIWNKFENPNLLNKQLWEKKKYYG